MTDKNPYRTLHARMSPPGAAWDEGFAAGRAALPDPPTDNPYPMFDATRPTTERKCWNEGWAAREAATCPDCGGGHCPEPCGEPAAALPDERLREALLSDAAVEAAAMTYEPDTFIGDAPNADDALRDARAVLVAALAAADREKPDECRAPHCWSEYGTPCATCPAATPDPPTDERRPWPIAPDTVMPPRRQPVRWGSRADDPPTEIHDDPGKTKAYLAGLAAGRTEAAAASPDERLREALREIVRQVEEYPALSPTGIMVRDDIAGMVEGTARAALAAADREKPDEDQT